MGILFIWYKRKATLATSTVGHLHKLIPSLKEQKPSLNSLLPILSEFVHPTKTKTTNIETANVAAGSQQSPTHDEHSIPVMVLRRHHTKSNQLKMATPTTTPTVIEPISLELFNFAAADLDPIKRVPKIFVQQNHGCCI